MKKTQIAKKNIISMKSNTVHYIMSKAFGKKDIHKLTKKKVVNKKGDIQTVYVKNNIENKESKVKKLSASARKWLREAIDSIHSYAMPDRKVREELKQFAPSNSVEAYRGMLFSSKEQFLKFLESSNTKNDKLTYKQRENWGVSSWSHDVNDTVGFATRRAANNMNQATLDFLLSAKSGDKIDGEYGIIIKGNLTPDNILVDTKLLPHHVETKRYAMLNEVFVNHDANVDSQIVAVFARKDGQIEGDISEFINNIMNDQSSNLIIDKQVQRNIENYKSFRMSGQDAETLFGRQGFIGVEIDRAKVAKAPYSPKDAKLIYKVLRRIKDNNPDFDQEVAFSDMRGFIGKHDLALTKDEIANFVKKNMLSKDKVIDRTFDSSYDIYKQNLEDEFKTKMQEAINKHLPKDWYEQLVNATINHIYNNLGEGSKRYAAFKTTIGIKKSMTHYISLSKSHPEKRTVHKDNKTFQQTFYIADNDNSNEAHQKKLDIAKARGIRVPPAWKNIWVNPDEKGDLQVKGIDQKGRVQYIYSSEHSAKAAAEKFKRLQDFANNYDKLMKRINKDFDKSDEAKILYLIATTGFRVGSDKDTKAEKKTIDFLNRIQYQGKQGEWNDTKETYEDPDE